MRIFCSWGLLFLILCSCTTLRKTRVYSAAGGAIAGGFAGSVIGRGLSPNAESEKGNRLIGLGIGTVIGALAGIGIGNFFYHEDPENKELKQMLLEEEKKKKVPLYNLDLGLSNITINPQISQIKKYQVPVENLPDRLKGMVKKQYIYEYIIPEQVIQTDDGTTLIIQKTEALEHSYER